MSNASHTPGPWKSRPENKGSWTAVVHAAGGECIAVCSSGSADNHANARLVAAAPELLEALQFCLDQMDPDRHTVERIDKAMDRAYAAIAKAEGK